jgi:hypothetical protein
VLEVATACATITSSETPLGSYLGILTFMFYSGSFSSAFPDFSEIKKLKSLILTLILSLYPFIERA